MFCVVAIWQPDFSEATGNMTRKTTAKHIGATIRQSSQSAHQADGSSPQSVMGETCLSFVRDGKEFSFEGLVV